MNENFMWDHSPEQLRFKLQDKWPDFKHKGIIIKGDYKIPLDSSDRVSMQYQIDNPEKWYQHMKVNFPYWKHRLTLEGK